MANVKLPPIELRHLTYFVAVADVGTISGGASRLGITQPSLSDAVSRIEELLGTQLIIRSARGVELTQAGFALARYGREILRGVDIALDEVRLLGTEMSGPVAV